MVVISTNITTASVAAGDLSNGPGVYNRDKDKVQFTASAKDLLSLPMAVRGHVHVYIIPHADS